jgi:hypothetical protein
MFVDDLVSPLRVVSIRDQAIDWYAMQEHGVTPLVYAETRDAASVRALPGKHPRWYHLRALTVAESASCDVQPSAPGRMLLAFRYAVTRIEDFYGFGTSLAPELPIPNENGGTRFMWSDAALQRVADHAGGMRLLYEIGDLAYERAAEGNGRSGDVLFTPPLFLQPVLDQIKRRLAVRIQASAGTESSVTPDSDSPSQSAQT